MVWQGRPGRRRQGVVGKVAREKTRQDKGYSGQGTPGRGRQSIICKESEGE